MCMLICGNNLNHISTFHVLYRRERDADAREYPHVQRRHSRYVISKICAFIICFVVLNLLANCRLAPKHPISSQFPFPHLSFNPLN